MQEELEFLNKISNYGILEFWDLRLGEFIDLLI